MKFITNKEKVNIICPQHGDFWQSPQSHLNGNGCAVCSGTQKITVPIFINRCTKKHSGKYDYSKVEFKTLDDFNDKLNIHSDFKSTLLIFAASDPNFNLYGYVIKIMYDSGVYQLVSNAGTSYTYDSNGYLNSYHGRLKEDVWNSLIIKYIGEEEFNQHKLSF